jgi:hypothetical protein
VRLPDLEIVGLAAQDRLVHLEARLQDMERAAEGRGAVEQVGVSRGV